MINETLADLSLRVTKLELANYNNGMVILLLVALFVITWIIYGYKMKEQEGAYEKGVRDYYE